MEKDNFNLKLRIFYLEEKLSTYFSGDAQQLIREVGVRFACRGTDSHLYLCLLSRQNIDLRSDLENKSRELDARDHLLVKARNVIENQQTDIEVIRAQHAELIRSQSYNPLTAQLERALYDEKSKRADSEQRLAQINQQLQRASVTASKAEGDSAKQSEVELTLQAQTEQIDKLVGKNGGQYPARYIFQSVVAMICSQTAAEGLRSKRVREEADPPIDFAHRAGLSRRPIAVVGRVTLEVRILFCLFIVSAVRFR